MLRPTYRGLQVCLWRALSALLRDGLAWYMPVCGQGTPTGGILVRRTYTTPPHIFAPLFRLIRKASISGHFPLGETYLGFERVRELLCIAYHEVQKSPCRAADFGHQEYSILEYFEILTKVDG